MTFPHQINPKNLFCFCHQQRKVEELESAAATRVAQMSDMAAQLKDRPSKVREQARGIQTRAKLLHENSTCLLPSCLPLQAEMESLRKAYEALQEKVAAQRKGGGGSAAELEAMQKMAEAAIAAQQDSAMALSAARDELHAVQQRQEDLEAQLAARSASLTALQGVAERRQNELRDALHSAADAQAELQLLRAQVQELQAQRDATAPGPKEPAASEQLQTVVPTASQDQSTAGTEAAVTTPKEDSSDQVAEDGPGSGDEAKNLSAALREAETQLRAARTELERVRAEAARDVARLNQELAVARREAEGALAAQTTSKALEQRLSSSQTDLVREGFFWHSAC